MIKPTVGRVVWYFPTRSDPGGIAPGGHLAAIIAHVWSDTCVNLAVFSSDGTMFARTSVRLVQTGLEERPVELGHCEWMPYQMGQAQRTQAAETALLAAN